MYTDFEITVPPKDEFGTIRERASPAILRYYIDKRDDYEKLR